ncbi:MAG: hypothetical protein KA369_01480 [Spirochaetes bacterium]|nr:hypothetical protein [Spirochaetota bacterium]
MKKSGKGHVYMRLDRMKKVSGGAAKKARSLGMHQKVALAYRSRRLVFGVILLCVVAWFANNHLAARNVEPKCWFCSAGEQAEIRGVVTKTECISYSTKARNNEYRVEYSYTVNGKTYAGVGYQTGYIVMEKSPVTVDYSVKDPSCSCIRDIKCAADNAMFTVLFGVPLVILAILLIVSGAPRIMRAIWVIEHGTAATATVGTITRKTETHMTGRVGVWRTTISWTATCSFTDASGKNCNVKVGMPEGLLKKGDEVGIVYDPAMPENAIAIGALPWFVKTDPPLAK